MSAALGSCMIDLQGPQLTPEERELLGHPQLGGIILFSRNYQDPTQLKALLDEIRQASHTHLLVAVDHEGGRVQRFREGFTRLPAARQLGKHYQQDPHKTLALAEEAGWLMAAELRAIDIDFSFAPVLDLDYGSSEVIGDRSFHRDPQIVAELAVAYSHGMQRAGMAAVCKHFPGHGAVSADSHTAIPIDTRPLSEIMVNDIKPFTQLIANNIAGIMPAHIVYPQVDSNPPCFSTIWLQQLLRQQLNFSGAIFSDDLSMVGASAMGDIHTRAERALHAGCDMILVCNDRENALATLNSLEHQGYNPSAITKQRLRKFIGQGTLQTDELLKSSAWQQATNNIKSLIDTVN